MKPVNLRCALFIQDVLFLAHEQFRAHSKVSTPFTIGGGEIVYEISIKSINGQRMTARLAKQINASGSARERSLDGLVKGRK